MDLNQFLHDLHFDVDKARPPDWDVDWDDAPLPYKLYRGLPTLPLSSAIPLSLDDEQSPEKVSLQNIGHLLWYTYGLTHLSQSVLHWAGAASGISPTYTYRRFAPSGGGLYPSELYVYLKLDDAPVGVYHYDAAHHRLVLLREGNFDDYLRGALGHRCDVSSCCGLMMVSTVFWKNYFKYCNFSYRLQGLDAGAVLGQLLEVSRRFGFQTGVYYQFLDRALNHLIGVSEQEESVYAVVPLSLEPVNLWFSKANHRDIQVTATDLCKELPTLHHKCLVRSKTVVPYPMLTTMNAATLLESTQSIQSPSAQTNDAESSNTKGWNVPLPNANSLGYDLAHACRNRYSPGFDFVLGHIDLERLATLLLTAANVANYRDDLHADENQHVNRVSLCGCFYAVEGLQNGAYEYDSQAHTLRLIRLGDQRFKLQEGMSMHTVNLFQVPLCLHVLGDRGHLYREFGYRGYRMQQMETGIVMQRLLLIAAAMGMGGHPLLGYDVPMCDDIYKAVKNEKTSLIQMPMGYYHSSSRLEGRLHQ